MYKFYAFKRLTFDYSEGWNGLDESEDVGECGILKTTPKKWYSADGYTYLLTIKTPAGLSKKSSNGTLHNIVQYSLGYSCRCEHDCCGHFQHNLIWVKKSKRREIVALFCAHALV